MERTSMKIFIQYFLNHTIQLGSEAHLYTYDVQPSFISQKYVRVSGLGYMSDDDFEISFILVSIPDMEKERKRKKDLKRFRKGVFVAVKPTRFFSKYKNYRRVNSKVYIILLSFWNSRHDIATLHEEYTYMQENRTAEKKSSYLSYTFCQGIRRSYCTINVNVYKVVNYIPQIPASMSAA